MVTAAMSELFGYKHPLVAGHSERRHEVMKRHFGNE